MQKHIIFLLLITFFSGVAMDLPMERVSTDQLMAKFAGCFVAITGPGFCHYGYKITADPLVSFGIISSHPAPNWNGLVVTPYFLYNIQSANLPSFALCDLYLPERIWASRDLFMRLASEDEIGRAAEKIKNNEVALGTTKGLKALQLLKECRNAKIAKL